MSDLPADTLTTTIANALARHLWDNSDEYVDHLAQHVAQRRRQPDPLAQDAPCPR